MFYRKATTERDRIKLMTHIEYLQQCQREKEENQNKRINVCQLHNRRDSANSDDNLPRRVIYFRM